jgi:hypothetical protein
MYATVPVEAAKEDRVKLARRTEVFVAKEHMVELLRIFLAHMAQRDPREPDGGLLIPPHRKASR